MVARSAGVVAVLLTQGGVGVMGSTDPCACKFQGSFLTESVYTNYPSQDPGKYKDLKAVKIYGSTCAAWDSMEDTPWKSYCPDNAFTKGNKMWNDPDYNWCQQPWCYVDASCPTAVQTSVFNGSDAIAYYSYHACGHTADCYSSIAWNTSYVWPTGCPYDPTGGKTYKVHKSGDCACISHGAALSSSVYTSYPSKDPADCTTGTNGTCKKYPGMYKDMDAIKYYGTTCAAWDQVPGTPWASYCPANSEWCGPDYNWCQQPWCYVSSTCSTGVASSVFTGSTYAFYSYNTCLSTPDCYTNVAWNENATKNAPAACPFDSTDNGWYTAKTCSAWATEDVSGGIRAGLGAAFLGAASFMVNA